MILKIFILILAIVGFHIFVRPTIQGFFDGYMDAKNGRPFKDNPEEEEE